MRVRWTYQPTRWRGDEYSGCYEAFGDLQHHEGEVVGWVYANEEPKAIVLRDDGQFDWLSIDAIRKI